MITLCVLELQEILEDVHESLATPDNNTTKSAQNKTTTISPSASQQSSSFNTTKPNQINIATNQICCSSTSKTNSSQRKSSSLKNAAKFDSIAALTEIMDSSSSSNITIPASGSGLVQKSNSDPDADTSSTKTEVEEMELDQFSDLEDNLRAHENVRKKKLVKSNTWFLWLSRNIILWFDEFTLLSQVYLDFPLIFFLN